MTIPATMGWDHDEPREWPTHTDPPTEHEDRQAIIAIMKQAHEDHSWERHQARREEYVEESGDPELEWWDDDPDNFSHGYEGIRLVVWVKYAPETNQWGHTYWAEVQYAKKPWRATYGWSESRGASCYMD